MNAYNIKMINKPGFLKRGKVTYTQLYLKWIANKNLSYSTWNSAQCYVPVWMAVGRMDTMYIYGWVPSLYTWNYHNIVNWLYLKTKCFRCLKKKNFFNKQKTWEDISQNIYKWPVSRGRCSTILSKKKNMEIYSNTNLSGWKLKQYTKCQWIRGTRGTVTSCDGGRGK